MSLTAKIYSNSSISEWFNRRHSQAIDRIVIQSNRYLQTANPLATKEIPKSTKHCGLVKASAVYALLKHIGCLNNDKNWISNTHASNYLYRTRGKSSSFDTWINNTKGVTIMEETLRCLVAGALDISHRLRRDHDFIKCVVQHIGNNNGDSSSLNTNKKWVKPWQSEIEDVLVIVGYIARCYKWESNCLPVVNPTFELSSQVGGAEADLIIGDSLVGVVTSTSFTRENLHELLAYTLLDTSNIYSIRKLVWVYPLWQTSVVIECSKLFRDIQATRKEFRKMIEENYPLDEFNSIGDGECSPEDGFPVAGDCRTPWGTDTLKYSSH